LILATALLEGISCTSEIVADKNRPHNAIAVQLQLESKT
jgi:hypothetical protein